MQVFVPFSSPIDCAEALYNDRRRFNKQIVECRQILGAINKTGKGWFNHPVVKMYKDHKEWLELYTRTLEEYKKWRVESDLKKSRSNFVICCKLSDEADNIRPAFLTDEFCNQHKRRLYAKSSELYPQFAKYGKSEENWYVVNGELVKYVNGKRI